MRKSSRPPWEMPDEQRVRMWEEFWDDIIREVLSQNPPQQVQAA